MNRLIASCAGLIFLIALVLYSPSEAQISSIPTRSALSQAYQTIADEGSSLTQRNLLNFTGTGVSCVDNSGSSRTDCTITSGSAAGAFQSVITNLTPTVSTTSTTSDTLNIAAGMCWGVTKSAATARITAGTGSGSYVVYCAPSRAYVVLYSTGAGLTLTCSGVTCTDSPSPAIPEGYYPIASGSISANTPSRWGAPTNLIDFTTRFQFLASTGMSISQSDSVVTIGVDDTLVQMKADDYTIAGNLDASAATSTKPNKTGTSTPGTCSEGETFFETDANKSWVCTATNTWTEIGGGSTYDPMDQTKLQLVEEFFSGSTSTTVAGALGWLIGNVTGAGGPSSVAASGDHVGIVRITSGSSSGDEVAGQLFPINRYDNSTFEIKFIFRIPSTITSVRTAIGLLENLGGATTSNRITIRFDSSSDTEFKFETCSSGSCTTGNSTVTVVADTWYTGRIRSTSAGTILFSVNGESEVSQSTNVPSATTLLPAFDVKASSNSARGLDMDWWAMQRTGLSR